MMKKACFPQETIAAISTPWGKGAIGIVRISGKKAVEIIKEITAEEKTNPEAHKARVKWIVDPRTGKRIDRGVVWVSYAPKSYTGENMAEIHGHGGTANMEKLLSVVLRNGARIARPGEFTQRAFLNGKMDLAAAEAVCELIEAKNERAQQVALSHLEGALSNAVESLHKRVIEVRAELEARVDFPEEELDLKSNEVLIGELEEIERKIEDIVEKNYQNRFLNNAAVVGLVGRVNVGKSSILNALLGKKRVVVDESPGTTRDYIEIEAEIHGIPIVLVDTAGKREKGARAEKKALNLAKQRLAVADLLLCVADAKGGINKDDRLIWDEFGKKAKLIVKNKIDLISEKKDRDGKNKARSGRKEKETEYGNEETIDVSALTGSGIDALRMKIATLLGSEEIQQENTILVTNKRHVECFEWASRYIEQAKAAMVEQKPDEIVALELAAAENQIGNILGKKVGQQVLTEIFSKFCVGK